MSKRFIITLVLVINVLFGVFAETFTPYFDITSTYRPTKIKNGDFSTKPWINCYINSNPSKIFQSYYDEGADQISSNRTDVTKIYNGVDKGWNTTEIKTWDGNFFEWNNGAGTTHGTTITGKYSVDMNVHAAAVLWQDLTTYGGDVIRWTLDHAPSQASSDTTQTMRVEIGAPNRDSNNDILPATGYGTDDQSNLPNSQTIASTKATYTSSAVTGSFGYGNTTELAYLSVPKSQSGWATAKGVYVVPDGQTVTRFAFISEAPNKSCGNELANITFSTLIGNLSAKRNSDKSITIRGYWGDSDESKKLQIKFNTETTASDVDMTFVRNQNFVIVVPASSIPVGTTSLEIYHQDYESAKRTVDIVAGYITYEGLEGSSFSSQSDTNPDKYYLDTNTFTLTNPTKKGYEFVGWSGTDITGLSKTVTITQGSEGDRVYTANWHQHSFKYESDGYYIKGICESNDSFSYCCPYHNQENAIYIIISIASRVNLNDKVYPENATNKAVTFFSDNPKIVKVDKNGDLVAVSEGQTTVWAISNDEAQKKSEKLIVNVVKK